MNHSTNQARIFDDTPVAASVDQQRANNNGGAPPPINDADVEQLFEAIVPVRELYEPETLQGLAELLPYHIALENMAVLLDTSNEVFLVGMVAPSNYTHLRNVARALNISSTKLSPRLLTEARFKILLEGAYEQTVQTTSKPEEEHFEDLSDNSAKKTTIRWTEFETADEDNVLHRAPTDIEIGKGTGLRAAAERIILDAIKHRASDIHLIPQFESGYVTFRVDGVLYRTITDIPPQRMDNLANAFADMAGVDGYKLNQRGLGNEINILVKTKSGRHERMTLRFQGKKSLYGRAIVIRINRAVFRNFQQIGLEPSQIEEIKNALHQRTGVVLLTGATGSGKTNTLEAMLRRLEEMCQYRKHVIQIGNPIEFPNQRRTQLPVHGEESWAEALKDSMRMDPDIFSPGEFRDSEEAGIVFQAAATGHLTLTTLHTNNVASTFSRLDFLKIERDKQAGLIQLIVSQRLVPLLCEKCKVPDLRARQIANQLIDVVFPDRIDLKRAVEAAEGSAPFFQAKGCAACDYMGIKGRTCIAEILTVTPEISRMLRTGTDGDDVVKYAVRTYGMMTLKEAAVRKLCRGVISYDDIFDLLMSQNVAAPETETYAWQTGTTPETVYDATAEASNKVDIEPEDYIDAEVEFEEVTAAAA